MGLSEKPNTIEQEVIELEKLKKEVLKPYYERMAAVVERAKLEGKIDLIFQDDATGVCYVITPCKGQYVFNREFEIQRTRTADEKKGDLSMKRAEEAGFNPRIPESL